MKKLVALVVVGAVLSMAAAATAQEKPRMKFVNFEEMLLDGEFRAPSAERLPVHTRAKFERLTKLKKSVLPRVKETTEARSLR